ncbi:MAG: DUF2851 family protein [Bacteroidales bacterium]|nr:DUF2851 family protein [Bacteroidales bacterium]
MTEDFLYYLWMYHFVRKPLVTIDGLQLLLEKPGTKNNDSGPDFFDCRLKLGETRWAGNVEIHVKSSDWFRHGHHSDESYNNIILHVVYENDKAVIRKSGEMVPCLELKGKFSETLYEKYKGFLLSTNWIPCASDITGVGNFSMLNTLDRIAVERLQQKADTIQLELVESKGDFREVFYRSLMKSFGLKANTDAFEQLALSLPLSVLSKHKLDLFQLEAMLFGQAGLLKGNLAEEYPRKLKEEYLFLASKYNLTPMKAVVWKFMRMRPTNFPTLRIAQFASLLFHSSGLIDKILTAKSIKRVIELLRCEPSDYWKNHYRFGKSNKQKTSRMGLSFIHLILINTIVPYAFVYGRFKNDPGMEEKAVQWLEEIPPENNTITRHFELLGVKASSALHTQALIRLKTGYCDQQRCLHCPIGHQILNLSAQ